MGGIAQGMTWPAITGIMEGPDGNLYVLGRCNENSCAGRTEPAVLVYNSSGKLVDSWGSGLFNSPQGFMLDREGNVWITDAQIGGGKGNLVFKFTKDGELLMTLGKAGEKGSGPDVFDQPTSIAIAPNGDVFVGEGHSPLVAMAFSSKRSLPPRCDSTSMMQLAATPVAGVSSSMKVVVGVIAERFLLAYFG